MKTALVLAGHGSHITPQTAGIVWQHVDELRAMGVADEVTAAFWKETPSFHQVFNSLTADDITVVPLFTAQGYFTQTVIPAEMGLDGPLIQRDGRIIRYTRTLSEHPYLANIVRQRVQEALSDSGANPAKTAVAIIGHSTRRNPDSRKATEAQADRLRDSGIAAEVVAVYLDDSPGIADVYRLTSAPTLIAVPYFLAFGSHATIDVPNQLGLLTGETEATIHERHVIYTAPVGVEDSLCNVILALARDAGMPLYPARQGSPWDCFPTAGREEFIANFWDSNRHEFGELELISGWVSKSADSSGVLLTLTDPDVLRNWVRIGPADFRPLATSRNLPGGWRILVTKPEMLHAIVETIYPGAIADWAHLAVSPRGTFHFNTLEQTAYRQTGMYRAISELISEQRDTLVSEVCGNCVRHPTWHHGSSLIAAIPCVEPCNMWMSRAIDEKTE